MTPEQEAHFRLLKVLEQHPEYSQRDLAEARGMWVETGIDLYKMLDAADVAEKTMVKSMPYISSTGIVSGMSGVFSGFIKQVNAIGAEHGVDPRDIFFELGRRNPAPRIVFCHATRKDPRGHDFFANTTQTTEALGVQVTVGFVVAVERTMRWLAHGAGVARRIKEAA